MNVKATLIAIVIACLAAVKAQDVDIISAMDSDDRFKTLRSAIGDAELVKLLRRKGPYTIFAPTEKAFKRIRNLIGEGRNLRESLIPPELRGNLTSILRNHIVPGKILPSDFTDGSLTTLGGEELAIVVTNAKNGRIRVNKLTKVKGRSVVETSNGVIYPIDTVVLPPRLVAPKNILELVSSIPFLKDLANSILGADLVATLLTDGPFMIFAPSNAAFKKLGPKLKTILLPENRDRLRNLIFYHIVPMKAFASDLVDETSLPTLLGEPITVTTRRQLHSTTTGESVFEDGQSGEGGRGLRQLAPIILNDGTKVTNADLEATNGIIHVINGVLDPPSKK